MKQHLIFVLIFQFLKAKKNKIIRKKTFFRKILTPYKNRSSSDKFIIDFPSDKYDVNAFISDSFGIKCCNISIVSVVKIFKSRLQKKNFISKIIYFNIYIYLFNARIIVFTSRSSFRRAIALKKKIIYVRDCLVLPKFRCLWGSSNVKLSGILTNFCFKCGLALV